MSKRRCGAQVRIGDAAVFLAGVLFGEIFGVTSNFAAARAPMPPNALALVLQQALGDGPALVQLSNEVFLAGDLDVLEERFAERPTCR